MKNILIPTDFSDNAWDALVYAHLLLENVPTRFFILNTYQAGTSRTGNRMASHRESHLHRVLKEESERGLLKIRKKLEKECSEAKNREFEFISQMGDLTVNVRNIIPKEQIDAIIMGTTGATGAKGIFMGSNAVKVINNIIETPVLTVPKGYRFKGLNRIVFATDLKKEFNRDTLLSLIELQEIHKSRITILHVREENDLSKEQEKNLSHIRAMLSGGETDYAETELERRVANTIIDFSEDNNMDLVCLVNEEKKFLQKLTEEAVVKRVSFRSETPILTLSI